jgi:hypothetical protein
MKRTSRKQDDIKTELVQSDSTKLIYLIQERVEWFALVNTVMNPQVAWNTGNVLTGWATSVSEKELCFMELVSSILQNSSPQKFPLAKIWVSSVCKAYIN